MQDVYHLWYTENWEGILVVRARSKKRGPGQPRRLGADPAPPVPAELQPSLPPAGPEPPRESPSDDTVPQHVALTREPTVRERSGMQIVAMRIAGMSEVEIATALGISKDTLPGYVYLASKGGWLDLPTAKEAINYNLIPLALRKLYQAMRSTNVMANGLPESTHVALKIAEGTSFKEWDKVPEGTGASTVVAIKIEMPTGPMPTMREDTTGGTPAFVDAEVVHGV